MTALFFSCLSFVFFFFLRDSRFFFFPLSMLLVSERKKDTRKNCLYNVFFFVFNVHVCFILSCIAYVVMLPFHLFSFATFIIIQRIAARTITHVHTHTHTLFIAFPATAVCSGFPSLFFVLSKKQSNNTPFFPVSFYLPFFFFRLRSVVS